MNDHQILIASLEKALCSAAASDWPIWLGELERLKAIVWTWIGTPGRTYDRLPQDSEDAQLFDIPQVAKQLNIPECRVYELARQGKIGAVKIGKYVRVPRKALVRYVASLISPLSR
jgi:excisionase family DNA binding protein